MKLKDYQIIVVDTETTGLDPEQHEIIEIAAVVYDQKSESEVDSFCAKAAPRNIETAQPKALEINGYNKNKELYIRDIEDVMREFHKMLDGRIVLGQNIEFDLGFVSKYCDEFGLKKEFHRHKVLDLKHIVWPVVQNSELEKLSLHVLCDYFGVSNVGEHSALVDCYRTLDVYKKVMELQKPWKRILWDLGFRNW